MNIKNVQNYFTLFEILKMQAKKKLVSGGIRTRAISDQCLKLAP